MLLATSNAGKVREFRLLLPDLRLVSPSQRAVDPAVVEDGASFCANAEIKARAFAAASGNIVIADDSGLEVDALGGQPGILSARFGGAGLDDRDRYRLLLERLEGVAEEERRARFCCCLVALAPDGRCCRGVGSCEGRIATQPAGSGGFGYDPVFFVPELDRTMAQLTAAEKSRISHRIRAVDDLRRRLFSTFPELIGS